MTPSIILLIAAAALNIGSGLLILFQGPLKRINRLFFTLTLAISFWVISNAVFVLVTDYSRFIVALLSYGAALLVAICFYLFCHAMSGGLSKATLKRVVVIIGVMSAFLSMIPGVIAYGVNDLAIQTNRDALAIYGVLLVAFFTAGLVRLFNGIRKTDNAQEKARIIVILSGLLVAIIIGVSCNLILPLLGKYDYVQLGPVGSLALIIASAYAIVRHRLFDIRLAVMRTVAYGATLTTLTAIYYAVAYIVSVTFLAGDHTPAFGIANVTIALLLAFIFQPIKKFFDIITNDIFYREQYNTDEFYTRVSEVLTTTTDLRNLLDRVANEIGATLKAEQAFFFVQYHDHHMVAGTARHTSLPLGDAHRVDEHIRKTNNDVIVADILPEDHPIYRLLISHRVAVMMPLIRGKIILGYLALGDQRSGGYTNRDIKVLRTISDELVIAIQNALSVQEVRDINKNLQQRIESATAELRTSNTQLRHLDKTKDEFLSMASHQLRTPLTSVKGYLSMVLEGDAGKVTNAQKQLLSEAFTSSERMVHLIHDFLNVSRLQTGKFMLEQHPYDLAKLVTEEVKSLQRSAETRNMKLVFTNSVGELVLNIDENKIRQVIMNFIDNALFYSHDDSTITVELTKTNDNVELRVKDNGIGVPKGEQSQLFTKFYRASNARKQRPDGTGVGIFLAKKVITEHGGNVLFESVEGKGSTFGFTLPIEKLRVELQEKSEQSEE